MTFKRKTRVLLADDHAIIRDGLKQILDDTPDLVVAGEAANGHDVLQLVREGEWDVLVLDISMPGRSGLDLIRVLKDESPDLPILVLSMHHEEQYAVRALHAGALGYITKENDGEVLVSAIRRVASGGVYVTPNVAALMIRGAHANSEQAPHTALSDREYQIFCLIVAGKSLTEIAEQLCVSVKTVSTHKAHILQKMGMNNAAALVRYAVGHRLVEPLDL